MPTEVLPTRSPTDTESAAREGAWSGLGVAIALHLAVLLAVVGIAYVAHSDQHWGDRDPTAGSIQATMVSSIPLPSRVKPVDKEVLAPDHASDTPTPPPPAPESKARPEAKPEPPPKPNEVLIPDKRTKTAPPKNNKPADKPVPESPKHAPVTPPPPTPKATSGEAATQIPMAVTQTRNGTASLTVDDRPFGDRYAYYIKLIVQKITQSKAEDPDPPETRGKKTVIRFVITRDGSPTEASVETRSGSVALDTSTLRAVERIDSFGPLPQGNRFVVHFEYDSH